MTTQAQIEAARTVILSAKAHAAWIPDAYIRDAFIRDCDKSIAALTAAAEVRDLGWGGWKVVTNEDGSETAYRNLPAAEVSNGASAKRIDPALRDFIADTPISEPNDGWAKEEKAMPTLNSIYMRGYIDGSKEREAVTIERCAQIAKDAFTREDGLARAYIVGEHIAKLILASKEKL